MNRTPLHLAALTGNGTLYRRLVELGLDPRSMDQKGRTAEQYLRNNSSIPTAELQELLALSNPVNPQQSERRLSKIAKSSSKTNINQPDSPTTNGTVSGSSMKITSKPVRLQPLSRPAASKNEAKTVRTKEADVKDEPMDEPKEDQIEELKTELKDEPQDLPEDEKQTMEVEEPTESTAPTESTEPIQPTEPAELKVEELKVEQIEAQSEQSKVENLETIDEKQETNSNQTKSDQDAESNQLEEPQSASGNLSPNDSGKVSPTNSAALSSAKSSAKSNGSSANESFAKSEKSTSKASSARSKGGSAVKSTESESDKRTDTEVKGQPEVDQSSGESPQAEPEDIGATMGQVDNEDKT